MAVELLRENQDFRRAEFDAETAALATVPINKDLAAELSSSRGCVRHLNLEGKATFSEPSGANCPILRPLQSVEHFMVHFDPLINRK
jgi:hypothetical protein